MVNYSKTNCDNTLNFLKNDNSKIYIYENSSYQLKTNAYLMLSYLYDKIKEINNLPYIISIYLVTNNHLPKEISNYILEYIDLRIIPSLCITNFINKINSSFNAFRFWLNSDMDFYRNRNVIQCQLIKKMIEKSCSLESDIISVVKQVKLIKNYKTIFKKIDKKYILNTIVSKNE